MISVARFAAAMTAIGAFIVTGLASAAAGVMVARAARRAVALGSG